MNKNSFGGIIMWLAKEERRLLAYYAKRAGQPSGNWRISDDELIRLMKFPSTEHLHNVKRKLKDKGLVDFTYLEKHADSLNVIGRAVPIELEPNVMVTQDGFDLGMEYTKLFGTFRVWCKEYYWLWAFIAALASIIGIIISIVCNE